MLVYWESMVWRIIANGVVYAKYKNVYKTKLMVLNCRLFPPSPCGCGHDTCLDAVDGAMLSGTVRVYQRRHCPPIFSLVMLHYHRHSGLMYGSPVLISSGYRCTFINDVYISLYQPDILFVRLQFIDTCCQTKAS